MNFLTAFLATFFLSWVAVPLFLWSLRFFGFYAIVREGEALVFMLFGRVAAVLDEPGLHFLWLQLGPKALLCRFFGRVYNVDLRLDQQYQRSQPVNSEEGTPMGIGVWYEMRIEDPVAFLFKNADPRGSLRANVTNATVRCLSNMPLSDLLENRHGMSRIVRAEVSPKCADWGYRFGSVYIRKVHFRDLAMIRQIEQKVVNRLRQVTSAIRQAGANQVDVITSAAEKEAAAEFSKAAAMRPYLVGLTLRDMSGDPEVLDAVFECLEMDRILKGEAEITVLPQESILARLLAAKPEVAGAAKG